MKTKFLSPKLFDGFNEEEITPIGISDLSKGDVFYEGNMLTENIELLAISDPEQEEDGWSIQVQRVTGEIIELYVSENTKYPKPDFYRIPQDIVLRDNGKYVYQVY